MEQNLIILHFNDVYDIDTKDCPRFVTAFNSFNKENPLKLFSGDAFAPSFMSTKYNGQHMTKVLNSLGIHYACFGNHDFDFPLQQVENLKEATNFSWIISNVKINNVPLVKADEYKIITHNEIKIGIMGLIEKEWLDLIEFEEGVLDLIQYEPFCECAQRLLSIFEQNDCQIIIALTHMRTPNDIKLLEQVPQINLILGGHDHVDLRETLDNRDLIKSGTNFQEFSKIHYNVSQKKIFNHERIIVDQGLFEPNNDIQNHINFHVKEIEESHQEILGYTLVDIDTRFSHIRTQESLFKNFYADLMRFYFNTDIAMVNSGTIRSDCVFKQDQPLTVKDIHRIMAFVDQLTVVEINGAQLLQCLENSVAKYPAFEGRFSGFSGMTFEFDPTQEPYQRIKHIKLINQNFALEQIYTMAVKRYIAKGHDGFSMLKNLKQISTQNTSLQMLLFDFFGNHYKSQIIKLKYIYNFNYFLKKIQEIADFN